MDHRKINTAEIVDRIQTEIRKWIKGFSETDLVAFAKGEWIPAIDLYGDRERLVLLADLPGIGPDALSITLRGDVLTISGEKPAPPGMERAAVSERKCGPFRRTLTLPFRPDPASVKATIKDGVLILNLERLAADSGEEIKINVG